jgi:hypothetical protein
MSGLTTVAGAPVAYDLADARFASWTDAAPGSSAMRQDRSSRTDDVSIRFRKSGTGWERA